MKVLAVASYGDRAEAETFIGLHRSGVEVELLCEPEFDGYTNYEAAGVPVSPCRFAARMTSRPSAEFAVDSAPVATTSSIC